MATIQNKIIGTSGDYTTIAAWEAAIPANLVTADEVWVGKLKDQTFTEKTHITGHTTDATRYIELTTDTAASFADDDTNRLDYDAAQGAAITSSLNYDEILALSDNFTRLTKLQVTSTGTGAGRTLEVFANNCTIRDSIIQGQLKSAKPIISHDNAASTNHYINCLIIADRFTNAGGAGFFGGGADTDDFINCTVVCPSDVTNTTSRGINRDYNDVLAESNAVFGFATNFNKTSGWRTGSSHNAADDATADDPGATGAQNNLTYANQFTTISGSSLDFRLKSGNDLDGAGEQHALTNDLDIFGNARDTSTPSVGCFETQAAVPVPPSLIMSPYIPA